MRRLLLFVFIAVLTVLPLSADVFRLFHPDVSYYENFVLLKKEIIGPFAYNEPPEVSENVTVIDRDCYLFYSEGRYKSYLIDGERNYLTIYIDNIFSDYSFKTGDVVSGWALYRQVKAENGGGNARDGAFNISYIPQVYSKNEGELLPSFHIEEESAEKVVIKSNDGSIEIIYQEYGNYALKTIKMDGELYYCRWILGWREVEGDRIPTREAFFIPCMYEGQAILFKESSVVAGFGIDYGPFDLYGLPALGEKLRSVL